MPNERFSYRTSRLASLVLLSLFGLASVASAQGVLNVEIVNGYNLVVDSNVTSPSTYAPSSAYIGARICNTGNAPLNDVIAYAGNYPGGPGVFPVSTPTDAVKYPSIANSGNYSLTLESGDTGTADATRYIGTLAAGQCRMQYFLISYPQCKNVQTSPGVWAPQSPPCSTSITGSIQPTDDLKLNYDVWATTASAIATPTVTARRDFNLRNEISAAANKIWPNTAAKVPDEYLGAIQSVIGWGTLGPDGQPMGTSNAVYPGQRVITTQGIWYDLGNVGQGFDNNGDLVPDQNAWLQPVGDPDSFDAGCFRMVNVYGIVIVKLKSGGELLIPFQNQLYFENIPDNTGVVGLVYYQFIALKQGCSAAMTPYQEAASGFDNEKFSADFGLANPLISASYGASFSFTKTDDATSVATGATLPYTATATNSSSVNLGAPDLGVPLVIREKIPAGTTYVAGSATTTTGLPSGTGTYRQGFTDSAGNLDDCLIGYQIQPTTKWVVLYSTNNGTSWTLTAPAPAAVTDIQWLLFTDLLLDGRHDGTNCIAQDAAYDDGALQVSLPSGKAMTVGMQVTVNGAAGPPVICNTATAGFGSSPAMSATDCTVVSGINTLSGSIFKDDAIGGGIYGNGVKDGTEAGFAAGISVSLYYDADGDGALGAADILYATTTTTAAGTYSFTNLPDGPFLVAAKKYDGPTSNGVNDAVSDASFGATGWGNTTRNPDLLLTTDDGVLKLSENSTSAILAVNLDFARNTATPTAVTTANFGFAPPLRVTKAIGGYPDADANGVADTAIDEGESINYVITLENRLPSVGRQGPSGCEYTVWAPTGTNGSPAGKAFTAPANAWDGPNRSSATALVEGGGLRFLSSTGFSLRQQPGNITKVEALYLGFFSSPLTDDRLDLTVTRAGIDGTRRLEAALIDSFIGAPADLDPNSAIPWDLTNIRPGGGLWTWADNFSAVTLTINPSKASAADQKTFALDAVGIRITTDQACLAAPSTTLSPVPLQDSYDPGSFDFVTASPAPTSVNSTTGIIQWSNVGPVVPGSSKTVTVTLRAKNVAGIRTGTCGVSSPPALNSVCNWAETAFLTNHVYYADGRIATDGTSKIAGSIQGKGEIRGTIWSDNDNNGWAIDNVEPKLPNVSLTLWGCVDGLGAMVTNSVSKTCENATSGNSWKALATTSSNSSGSYEFIGLDTGFYLVEVGNTDSTPGSGNTSPFGKVQTAEPLDAQTVTAGNANGTDCSPLAGGVACNNTWGWGAASPNLSALNLIDAATEEIIAGANFGYYSNTASVFGNVWRDVNANGATVTTPEAGESGLAGFTVQIYADTNNNGLADDVVTATTTTDAAGNYTFGSLPAGPYVIKVTPLPLLSKAWVETVESTGIATSLNNQIAVTLTAGALSGSHSFGYTQTDTADIGDTLFFDLDSDGIQDPLENGIASVTVWLYRDVDRDGVIEAGIDSLIRTDVTDGSGKYLFEDLPAGSYIVKVDRTDPDFPSDTTPTADPDLNLATIGDLIYVDSNGSFTWNAGEDGIARVIVNLYADSDRSGTFNGGDVLVSSTVTDMRGQYLFTGVPAGGYFVQVDETTVPTSFVRTSTDPATSLITLSSSAITSTHLTADVGYSPDVNFSIGNRVWHDVDNDGVQDLGEVGIPNIDVIVTGGSCATACRATTNAAGFWYVSGLANGTYSVQVDTTHTDFPRLFTVSTGTTNPRTPVTVAGVDLTNVDFGFRYTGSGTSPTGTITGRAYQDANNNAAYDAGTDTPRASTTVNLIDATGEIVSTTTSASDGTYSFNGVFVGTYTVEARDALGRRYSTIFLSAAETFPNLNVVYNPIYSATAAADDQSAISVDGVHANLLQDFGYKRYLASIGDSIYHDVNLNATQDLGEPGFAGVTVKLYDAVWSLATDTNGNGFYDAGEGTRTLVATTTTQVDDPATSANEGGTYIFANLATLPSGHKYLVEVVESTIGGVGTTKTLIADPDTDGTPCSTLMNFGAPGYAPPPRSVCDGQQLVSGFLPGSNYLGADFGYTISGPGYASFGDQLWIDTQITGEPGFGVRDSFERGIGAITVWLDTNNNTALDPGEPTATTDVDGFYAFTGLADGIYNVRVLTTDPDWPSTSLQVTYEARSTNDGSINSHVQVIIVGGVVTTIVDGDNDTVDTSILVGSTLETCGVGANCSLSVDFGYRYIGTDSFRGTVCIDDPAVKDGFCGSTSTTLSGVTLNETALQGIQVSLYSWTDDGDNAAWSGSTLDAGDTFRFIGTRTTDVNGDYVFLNIDTSNNVIAVFSLTDSQNLKLTTATSSVEMSGTDTLLGSTLYDGTITYQGNVVTVLGRLAVRTGNTGQPELLQDADFAFEKKNPVAIYDFGDLPGTYSNTLRASGGAQHVKTASLFLGAGVTADSDGTESADAIGEGDTADDGILAANYPAELNPGSTVTLPITIGGTPGTTGWILGWIDFNGDGDFNDMDEVPQDGTTWLSELAVDQQVTVGSTTSVTVRVPYRVSYLNGAGVEQTPPTVSFARFRLYTSRPSIISSKGIAVDSTFNQMGGEVEDYRFSALAVTAVEMAVIDAKQSKTRVTLTWKTNSETDNVGFNVYRQSANGARLRINKGIIQGSAFKTARPFAAQRAYLFIDKQPPAGFLQYFIEDLDLDGTKTLHGPVTPQLSSEPEPAVTTEPDPTLGSVGGVFTNPAGIGVPIPAPPSTSAAQLEEQWKLAAVPAVKVVVTKAGWYSVKKSDLVAAGFDPGSNAKVISVFSDGVEIPVVINGKNPAQFADSDTIEFFGRPIDTTHTGGRVYYITPRKGNGDRIKSVGGKGNSGIPAAPGFAFTSERIERWVFFSGLVNNGDRENFFGQVLFFNEPAAQTLTVVNRDTTASTASLEVVLQGATENLDHVVEVAVNGTVVGDARFRGMDRSVVKLDFPSSALIGGDNTVTLTARNGDEDVSVVESLRLAYSHQFRADDNALAFRVAGGTAVTVGGFTNAAIRVVDITDPRQHFFIDGTIKADKDGTQQVSFATSGQDTRTIYAFAGPRVMQPAQIAWNEASTWNATSNGAKLVVITNRAFVPAAKKLAAARQAQGIATAVVDVQNVYDEFSFGHHSPQAIRDFLAHASTKWTVKPRYVILMGDGSYDPRDYYGLGSTDYVPTKLVPTAMKKTASDDWFADFTNSGVPSLAIGRLPVKNADEAIGVVDKLVARMTVPTAPWAKIVDVISDAPGDYPFDQDADVVAATIPKKTNTANRISLEKPNAATLVSQAFNRGSMMTTYIGHGYVGGWNGGVLNIDSAGALANAERAPFVIALNCFNGQFEDSSDYSLGEALINNPAGGAIGVWASSALSTSPGQVALNVAFNRAIFAGTNVPVGDAIIQAKQAVTDVDVRRSWILFGDPTIPLR